jgi:hypothetical protein
MKSLSQHILESLRIKTGANMSANPIIPLDAKIFGFFDTGIFKIKTKTNSNDVKTTRTSTSKQQEKEVMDIIQQHLKDTNYIVYTSIEYAENILKIKWTPKFDLENGDLVIVDENKVPIMFIDVKVSDSSKYIGTITISSLLKFGKTANNHFYLMLSDLGVNHKFIRGVDVWQKFTEVNELMVSKDRTTKIDFDCKTVGWGNHHPDGNVYAEDFLATRHINKIPSPIQ